VTRRRTISATPEVFGVERETPRDAAKGRTDVLPFVFVRRAPRKRRLPPRSPPLISAVPAEHQDESSVSQRSEPMFNVPPVVVATVAVLVLVHALRMLVLTDDQDLRFLLTFAFIPARYDIDLVAGGSFPGGFGAELWTFFTYAFLHADLLHIGVNIAWLLPFGAALARRFGPWRYTAFMLVVAAAGAFAHLISHPGAMVPMIGASAAISGAMAAALRFVFQQGGPLGLWQGVGNGEAYRVPAASLGATLRDPRFLMFIGAWVGLNLLFGLGSVSIGEAADQEIAWQAHIGGFLAGLLLFNAFDPAIPRKELDASRSR
jgi:membrane associated rhomboid family serine protease